MKDTRERERFCYHLRWANMIYETKILHFYIIRAKVSNDSQCSQTLLMDIAIENARYGVRDIWASIRFDRRFVESKLECDHRWSIVEQ